MKTRIVKGCNIGTFEVEYKLYWLRGVSSESESIYGSIRDTISSLIKEIENG